MSSTKLRSACPEANDQLFDRLDLGGKVDFLQMKEN